MARRPVAFCLAVRSSDKHDISRFTVLQSLTQHRPFDADFIRMRPVSTRACARALYLWQHLVRTPTFPMPCPGAHGWYPRGAPQSQLAPGRALRTPRLQALRGGGAGPAPGPRLQRRGQVGGYSVGCSLDRVRGLGAPLGWEARPVLRWEWGSLGTVGRYGGAVAVIP